MVRPLRGGGGVRARPLRKKKLFFLFTVLRNQKQTVFADKSSWTDLSWHIEIKQIISAFYDEDSKF